MSNAAQHRTFLAPYVAEALGTFALVFVGPGAAAVNAASAGGVGNVGVGLSFGLIVATAIFTFGHISGAHINPAVSCGFVVLGRMSGLRLAGYVLAQLTGAVLAAFAIKVILGSSIDAATTVPAIGGWDAALASEFILTFFLMMLIVAVATDSRVLNAFSAVAVGAYVAAAATGWGPVAGASMNPARSFGPAVASGIWTYQWVYWLGPLLAAVTAVAVYETLRARNAAEHPREVNDDHTAVSGKSG